MLSHEASWWAHHMVKLETLSQYRLVEELEATHSQHSLVEEEEAMHSQRSLSSRTGTSA